MDAKRKELMGLVAALSHACKQDKNVLKDAALVDALETRGCEIARLRKQQAATKKAHQNLDMSPLPVTNKTTKKKLNQQCATGGNKSIEGVSKRRKLLFTAETKSNELSVSYRFPSIQRQQKQKKESTGEWISSLHSRKITDTCHRPTTMAVAVEVKGEAVTDPLKAHQCSHVRRSASPLLKIPRGVRAASPYKQMARASSPDTVDFSASLTSTMASCCDDFYDEHSVSSRRYNRSAMDRTPSFESMNWALSDDESSDESLPFRSIADEVEQQSLVSKGVRRQKVTNLGFDVTEHSESGAEEYFLADDGKLTTNSSSHVAATQPINIFPNVATLTEAVMEVLYGIMEHNESFKWLIDRGNQARVAKLVEYHLKKLHNSDTSVQACDEQVVNKLRMQVDKLVHENLKLKLENAQLVGSAAVDKTVENLKTGFVLSEGAVSVVEGSRREAEITFQSEEESKLKLISCLQRDLDEKVPSLDKSEPRDVDLPVNGGNGLSTEIAGLKNKVTEKDREICRLNFQLSTKQKVVHEVAKKVAQQLENVSSDETLANLHLDMDMSLFMSVAEKQENISMLEAALASMEREVAGLEARVAKKSHETLSLNTKLKSMYSRLTDANVNMSRVQTENDRLVIVLKEKQGKMRDLIDFLEGKEKQVMHLENQLALRQTQLEHVMAEFEKMQHLHRTEKSTSAVHPDIARHAQKAD